MSHSNDVKHNIEDHMLAVTNSSYCIVAAMMRESEQMAYRAAALRRELSRASAQSEIAFGLGRANEVCALFCLFGKVDELAMW